MAIIFLLHAIDCAAAQPVASTPDTVIATVGDDRIHASEAQRLMNKVARGKKINPDLQPYAQAQVLEELIARRLVLACAARRGEAASEAELAKARKQFQAQLAVQRKSLADFLKAQGIAEADLQRQLAWNVVWEKYLALYVTAERLAVYFQAHSRDFDGTELAVSHILLRSPGGGNALTPNPSPGGRGDDSLLKKAEAIRAEILAGKISFADAARKYSDGPSRKEGGKLGWIGRRGPMEESFSRAAFALQPGEISPVIWTSFGADLVRCDEVKPGTRQLAEVHKEVEDALARELLDKLATIERRTTAVTYTQAWPHFKPGTHDLSK